MSGYFFHERFLSVMVFSAVLVSGLAGCHHRQAQPVLLPAQTSVPIDVPPAPTNPPLVETPKTKLPPVPVAREEPNPKKTKKQRTKGVASSGSPGVVTAPAPAPLQSASTAASPAPTAPAPAAPAPSVRAADPPAESSSSAAATAGAAGAAAAQDESIGVFTVGGDQSPAVRQDASNLIASNERRLAAILRGKTHVDPSLVSKVRNFQKEAQQALLSGDANGAKTLATKGQLLLDDMDRGVASQ